ncbi:hypothetical protein EDD22DRAFT_1029272 [Suillus occidentalis]|nr:hypothetical protein EDD22DRAFT_1029272 [Suillus occidentalis]
MSPKSYRIVVLTGDGIGCAIDNHGEPLPASTLEICQQADAILLGSMGGPKWGPEGKVRPEQSLLGIRKALGLYAKFTGGVNMIIIRELIGGLYFGPRQEQGDGDTAYDTMVYSVAEVERITRVGAQIALAANPPLSIQEIILIHLEILL